MAHTIDRPDQAALAGLADDKPEGPVSAAIIAGGIGCFAMGVFTTWDEASTGFDKWLDWNSRVGPLSGKTILAVITWLAAWVVLHLVLRRRAYETTKAFAVALVLIGLGVLGTLPTFFQRF